jgi:hypothetical protein
MDPIHVRRDTTTAASLPTVVANVVTTGGRTDSCERSSVSPVRTVVSASFRW